MEGKGIPHPFIRVRYRFFVKRKFAAAESFRDGSHEYTPCSIRPRRARTSRRPIPMPVCSRGVHSPRTRFLVLIHSPASSSVPNTLTASFNISCLAFPGVIPATPPSVTCYLLAQHLGDGGASPCRHLFRFRGRWHGAGFSRPPRSTLSSPGGRCGLSTPLLPRWRARRSENALLGPRRSVRCGSVSPCDRSPRCSP